MADNLGDQWWIPEDSAKEQHLEAVSENLVRKSKKRKKQSVDIKPSTDDVVKNKKKRKNISALLISQEPVPLMPNHLISAVDEYYRNRLSPIEMDELMLDDEQHFANCSDLTHTATSYLKALVPHWKRVVKKAGGNPGCPVILIICCGGLRAVQFIREISDFKVGGCKIAKLFAKHFKLAEQAKFLNRTVIHIGVGTPNRITQLLDNGCLRLDALKYVVIDWSHRDVKQRRIIDMREMRTDLMDLLRRHLIPHVKMTNSTKLALY